MDCSEPGSSVHGILQARILEWVAVPFSRGFSQPRDQTQLFSIAGRFFTWATWAAQRWKSCLGGNIGKYYYYYIHMPEWLVMQYIEICSWYWGQYPFHFYTILFKDSKRLNFNKREIFRRWIHVAYVWADCCYMCSVDCSKMQMLLHLHIIRKSTKNYFVLFCLLP